MNRVWGHNFIPVCNKLNTCSLFALDIWSSNFFFIFLFLGKMCSSGRGISSLVLISSLLFGSQSFAGKTSRRFIGLPESGERVNYSNARENIKTLIIRHNLPVSDKIYLAVILHQMFWSSKKIIILSYNINKLNYKIAGMMLGLSSFTGSNQLLEIFCIVSLEKKFNLSICYFFFSLTGKSNFPREQWILDWTANNNPRRTK